MKFYQAFLISDSGLKRGVQSDAYSVWFSPDSGIIIELYRESNAKKQIEEFKKVYHVSNIPGDGTWKISFDVKKTETFENILWGKK